MANSQSAILQVCLLICWWCALVDSAPVAPSCMEKLISCQPYLKASSAVPSLSCCQPLKEIVADDAQCLCDVFENSELLKSLNVTRDDGLNLAKSCGANVETFSACKKSPPPAAPNNSSGTSPPAKSAANVGYVASYAVATAAILMVSAFGKLTWLLV